jgi:tetratricopeptide (TPR) repeat protein
MPRLPLSRCAAVLLTASLLASSPLFAQDLPADRPATLPAEKPSKAARDRAEAASLFGLGSLNEGRHRLLEALRCYEEACKLDPAAVAPRRALVTLYLALDRLEDSLATAKRVLELDPDDWETGTVYARQLRAQGKPKEATKVLRRAVESVHLKEKPDVLAQTRADLAYLEEEVGEWKEAAATLGKLAEMLDNPAPLIEMETLTESEAATRAAETYESLGRVWLKAGDSKKAVAAFETARKRDPARSSRLALHLAELHEKADRPREALARLDDYLACRPSGMEGYEMKIRLLKQLGQADRIVPALQAASSADTRNVALGLLLARELRRVRRQIDAEAIYTELIKDSVSPEVYRGLFGLFKEEGSHGGDRALHLLDQTVQAANKDDKQKGVPARNMNRVANPTRGDTAENQAANGRYMLVVLREDADLVKLILESARRALVIHDDLHPITCRLLAALAERTRQLDVAEELYRSCLNNSRTPRENDPARREGAARRPNNGRIPREDEQDIYTGLLAVLQAEHKFDDVITICKQGLEEAQLTNRTIFFLVLSQAHQSLGHVAEALAAADQAVAVSNPAARLQCLENRVRVLSRASRHAEAIAACQEMLREYNQPRKDEDGGSLDRQASNVRSIRLELSQVYSAAHDVEKSDEQLRLLLEADPDDVTANNNLGFQWAERGINLPEAERMIRKAIETDRRQRSTGKVVGTDSLDADRDSAAYVDSLGWVLYRKGDLKAARAELEKASTLPDGDDDPVVWDHLADVLFRLGEKDKANTAWRKALSLFDVGSRPKDDRYREIQQKLKQVAP